MDHRHLYVGDISPAEAKLQVRRMLNSETVPDVITVHLPRGIYSADDFVFTAEDCSPKCHVEYRGEEGAVVDGGVTIPKTEWQLPDDSMALRFYPEVRDKIRMADLSVFGLGRADWGHIQAVGGFEMSGKYPERKAGVNCQVFCGDSRMNLARWPNNGYDEIEAVMDVGEVSEFPPQNYFAGWKDCVSPRGGCYIMNAGAAGRVSGWKTDGADIWMFGYFYWDWADSSTPVTLDPANRRIFPKYVSAYGCRSGAHYYFYNVPEELDVQGEWYLDRDSAKLYFYPDESDEICFSCRKKPLISCENTVNMEFSNLTLRNTTGDAVVSSGTGMTFRTLNIQKIGGSGIRCDGYGNLVENCEISRAGEGGVYLTGGDREKLIPCENRVSNCYIHDFAEIYRTYRAGINLLGVGCRCDGNRICRTPHMAIYYNGNEHTIENNFISDAVTDSRDAGAIYGGRDWAAHGTVIRHNLLVNIGSEEFKPAGIYWDDGLSGQTAYGNVLVNVGAQGFLIGGGREISVYGNLIVNCGCPIHYDDRNRDGFVHGGWAKHSVNTPDAVMWKSLDAVPYDRGVWKEKYPLLARVVRDFNDADNVDFPANPSYSSVAENIVIDGNKYLGNLADSVYTYGSVKDNLVFADSESGDAVCAMEKLDCQCRALWEKAKTLI